MSFKAKLIAILSFFAFGIYTPIFSQTPGEIFSKAKSKITSAKTVKADFTMTVNGQSCKGVLTTMGKKFAIESNISSTWFNGKEMWTYISDSNETTIINPTPLELTQTNPLLYLETASNYNIVGSKKKDSASETITLIPKINNTGIKFVNISISRKSWLPTKITVFPTSGNSIAISLNSVKLNENVAESKFDYPKSKFAKAKIIDLRK